MVKILNSIGGFFPYTFPITFAPVDWKVGNLSQHNISESDNKILSKTVDKLVQDNSQRFITEE
jgi:hypothetical protein